MPHFILFCRFGVHSLLDFLFLSKMPKERFNESHNRQELKRQKTGCILSRKGLKLNPTFRDSYFCIINKAMILYDVILPSQCVKYNEHVGKRNRTIDLHYDPAKYSCLMSISVNELVTMRLLIIQECVLLLHIFGIKLR